MGEGFDSWKGFLDAGFAVQDDGRLRLASGRCGCTVARAKAGLEVRFEPGVSGLAPVRFELPAESNDLWQWAALFARRALGTRERWLCMKQALGKELSRDLAELLDFGFDHLDELPMAETSDKVERMDAKPSASGDPDLVSVRERLERLREVAWEELRIATEAHDLVRVKDAAARAEHVDELLVKYGEIETFLREPATVASDAVDASVPLASNKEVQDSSDAIGTIAYTGNESVCADDAEADEDVSDDGGEGSESTDDEHPQTATTHKGHCTNFAVTFPDGTRIGESKASVTFARTIEKIGAPQVAALNLEMAGDPIVTQDRSEIKKMPRMVNEIANGWFIKTHSSTYTKLSFLRRINDALDVGLKFELFRREPLPKPTNPRKPGRPPKPKRRDPGRFQIGRVVKHCFPKLFALGRIAEDEIAFFLSNDSKRRFGTRGYPVLRVSTGADGEHIVNGQRRYYSDVVLEAFGSRYLLTSQFITENGEAILEWLESKGFERGEMMKVGKGVESVPGLFEDITVFASDEDEPEPLDVSEAANDIGEGTSDGVGDVSGFRLQSNPPSLFDNLELVSNGSVKPTHLGGCFAAKDLKLKLRKLAKAHDYTPVRLAKGIGLPRKEVKGWFKGRGLVSREQLQALCRFMGVTETDFGVIH